MTLRNYGLFVFLILFFVGYNITGAMADESSIGVLIPGKGWISQANGCDGDSTPLQFIPKTEPDPSPLDNELKKYPRCVHCGMKRAMWHHSRHLVHYSDALAVGTCSIRCLAVNLSLNLDRGVNAIYAADFGSSIKPAPLIQAATASYIVGSKLKGTMTRNSKMAFSSEKDAQSIEKTHGGKIYSFDDALKAAYHDMAEDTLMIRKRRAQKAKKMKAMKP